MAVNKSKAKNFFNFKVVKMDNSYVIWNIFYSEMKENIVLINLIKLVRHIHAILIRFEEF